MEQIRLIMLVESRIRGNVYVRFGGEFLKTSHSNMERRWELSLLKKYQNQGEGYLWGLRLDKALIGFVGVIDLSCKPSIFYALHPKARHKGYMQESVLAIMNYLFRNNVCNQLSTEVKCGNTPSIKLLEKVGFVKLESSREIIRYESIFK